MGGDLFYLFYFYFLEGVGLFWKKVLFIGVGCVYRAVAGLRFVVIYGVRG